jgi:hypothetical protein
MLSTLALTQHCTNGVVTCIAQDLEGKFPVGRLYNGCRNECLLEGVEGYEAIFIEVEPGLFGKKTYQSPGYMEEMLDESPIKANVLQETLNSLDICRGWQLFNHLDLYPIHFYPFF